VPKSKVYDVRLLLAAAGLPKAGGTGFELFDRGDLGVSEFTQKVNLRRALEGELARTISHLAEVRSARVHVTLPEHGLYRDEDRKASAAVVLNLKPGLTPTRKALEGIRHLVASAVPGLTSQGVTVVDGSGSVLSAEEVAGETTAARERQLEREYEQKLVGLLSPVVGEEAVIARVTVQLVDDEVDRNEEVVDPEQVGGVVRSERQLNQRSGQDEGDPAIGIAGAATNQPVANNNNPPGVVPRTQTSQLSDETRNYEISKTVTTTRTRGPRLRRLSVGILLDGKDGKPLPAEEVTQLGETAKKAVGIDLARGDQFEISSAVFARPEEPKVVERTFLPKGLKAWQIAAAVLLIVLVALLMQRRRRQVAAARESEATDIELLRPGAKVGDIEAQLGEVGLGGADALTANAPPPVLVDPAVAARDRARELAQNDPVRATQILRAWMNGDAEAAQATAPQTQRAGENG
ncbi:MAG: hypothetical protein RL199_2433, partial [Pseudomonadota bacterium]